ncbi:septal ring lytic transglycosylase RlpA family protein [Roseibium sp.]|uniref:septal ring lytic transglycosylase RlpA family protein n=1 Tax=Roseibium sp. TaxID=1936156 RepID=UPI003A977629
MPSKSAFHHLAIAALVSLGFAGAQPITQAAAAAPELVQCGKASWYALTSRTASGEMADPASMTAAHRSLPFGSIVTVTNLRNGKSVSVRINDRGPFVKGRVIDVTKAAAIKLDFARQGVTRVAVSVNKSPAIAISDPTELCGS